MQSRRTIAFCIAAVLAAAVVPIAIAQSKWLPISEGPVAKSITGRWIWAELVTNDVAAAREFYSKVFGWSFEPIDRDAGSDTYWRAKSGGRPIAGVMKNRADLGGVRTAQWIGVMSSDDPQSISARVADAGGTVVVTPRRLEGLGDVALFVDPKGARFAVLKADRGDPIERAPSLNEWLWIELWSDDPQSELSFYQKVFGYGVEPADATGSTRSYLLTAAGKVRAGVLRKPYSQLPTEWVPYVRVESVEQTVARAVAAGARVVIGPTPHHRSRVAVLVDPSGAPFAVAEWRPQ